MLAWDHLKLLFDEIKEAKKLTPQHMQEFSTLSTEFPYAVLLLAEGSISKPSKTGLPYVILEAGNIIEVLPTNLHCSCRIFAESLSEENNRLACRHHFAVRLYRALRSANEDKE